MAPSDPRRHIRTFCGPDLLVIPPEVLSDRGVEEAFRNAVSGETGVDDAWWELFDESLRVSWERQGELHARAPQEWRPPRVQHVCVARHGRAVRPYFQPFHASAWLVHEDDFDPGRSHVEFGAFQLALVAQMSLLQQVAPAFLQALGYWFLRHDEEKEAFARICNATDRVDRGAYQGIARLASELGAVGEIYHRALHPPQVEPLSSLLAVPGSGLMASQLAYPRLQEVAKSCETAVRAAASAHYAQFGEPSPEAQAELAEWLVRARPRVVVTGGKQARTLWHRDAGADAAEVADVLGPLSAAGAASVRADLEVIDRCTRAFADRATNVSALPAPDEEHADQNGLSYMHLEHAQVAYNLDEPGMRRRLEPAPPTERWMLAARTAHEWAHLATEAGWVDVPTADAAEFDLRFQRLVSVFEEILDAALPAVRLLCEGSLRELPGGEEPAPALARFALARVEDFQSNLLAALVLEPEERETYVRNNVRWHGAEFAPEQSFELLARYAYEFQYLRFTAVDDPWRFFASTTWFQEDLVARGVVSEPLTRKLFEALGDLLDLYAVDPAHFRVAG